MIDALKKVMHLKGYWSKTDFDQYLKNISSCFNNSRIDWDWGDENWAMIHLEDKKNTIFVCFLYPIVLVKNEIEADFKFSPKEVCFVYYDDINLKFIDPYQDILKQAFDPHCIQRLISENEPLVSLHDIWWATVT